MLDEKTEVKVGDVIVAIDGEPVERRRENLGRMFAASTPQSLALKINYSLLLGPKDSRVRLTVRGLDSNTREIAVSRSFSANDPKQQIAMTFGPEIRSGRVSTPSLFLCARCEWEMRLHNKAPNRR